MTSIFVKGDPQPRPRQRFTARLGFVQSYTPHGTKLNPKPWIKWKHAVLAEALYNRPIRPELGPIRITVRWQFKPTATYTAGYRHGKPDLDNLEKLIYDALKEAKWFRDDAQICESICSKVVDQDTGVAISMSSLDA